MLRIFIPENASRFSRTIEIARVQWPGVIDCLAKLCIDLELQNGRVEVLDVVLIADHVVLGAGIEIVDRTRNGRNDSLVSEPQLPPAHVHANRSLLEHLPAPFLQRQSERQEWKFVECHREQVLDVDDRVAV